MNLAADINEDIQRLENAGQVSDGYHTFDELYEHRIVLWIAFCKIMVQTSQVMQVKCPVWKTRVHSDGSVMEGWFVLGMFEKEGAQVTYHLPESKWDDCYFVPTRDKAPDYDGHTSDDVIKRIESYYKHG